jgi:hypothetical protein
LKPDIPNPTEPLARTQTQNAAVTDPVHDILDRPPSQRLREYKYRFAQSLVFGLPVVALWLLGPAMGGPEASRWIGLLQVLLAGWVMYVGVVGMLVEALMRRRATIDGLAGCVAIGLYLLGAVMLLWPAVWGGGGSLTFSRVLFSCAAAVSCGWAALRWFAGSAAARLP